MHYEIDPDKSHLEKIGRGLWREGVQERSWQRGGFLERCTSASCGYQVFGLWEVLFLRLHVCRLYASRTRSKSHALYHAIYPGPYSLICVHNLLIWPWEKHNELNLNFLCVSVTIIILLIWNVDGVNPRFIYRAIECNCIPTQWSQVWRAIFTLLTSFLGFCIEFHS